MANRIFISVLLACMPIVVCIADVHAADKRLALTGSSTVAPLVSEIAKRFEQEHPEFRVDVQTGGSSRGIADAKRRLVDIGMSSRALHKAEQSGVKTHVLAVDGITFIVHAQNQIKNLTQVEARKIYTGEIQNWSELGGPEAEITGIDRAKGRGEKSLMDDFLKVSVAELKPDIICGENQQCIKLVAGNKNAITYLSVGAGDYESSHGSPIRLLSINGIDASIENVKQQRFPIVRPLVLITAESMTPQVAQFVEYSLSPKVNDLVKELAFVPVH